MSAYLLLPNSIAINNRIFNNSNWSIPISPSNHFVVDTASSAASTESNSHLVDPLPLSPIAIPSLHHSRNGINLFMTSFTPRSLSGSLVDLHRSVTWQSVNRSPRSPPPSLYGLSSNGDTTINQCLNNWTTVFPAIHGRLLGLQYGNIIKCVNMPILVGLSRPCGISLINLPCWVGSMCGDALFPCVGMCAASVVIYVPNVDGKCDVVMWFIFFSETIPWKWCTFPGNIVSKWAGSVSHVFGSEQGPETVGRLLEPI